MRSKPLLTAILAMSLAPAAAAAESAAEQLETLFADHLAWQLDEFPEMAMRRGDYSGADHLADVSLAAIDRRYDEETMFLQRLFLVPYDELDADDQLDYDLFERTLRDSLEGRPFRMFLAPMGGRYGPQQRIPQMAEQVRFERFSDYEQYLARLQAVPAYVDQTIAVMRQGLAEGRTPPRVTLAGVPDQLAALLDDADGLAALGEPLDRMPDHFTDRQRGLLRDAFSTGALPAVRGALQRLDAFVIGEYIPGCRESIAATDLPDGDAYYAYRLRVMTTTRMTAREIHELGLSEVARIRAEMMAVIRASDFMDRHRGGEEGLFEAFLRYLRTDRRFYHETEAELLAGYRDICKRVDAWMPRLFATLPRLPYGVRKIPDFMAPSQTTAYYRRGDIRNAEPGWFFANTYALDQRPTYEMIPLALHEAVPGHHLQIALAQELEGLPDFRTQGGFTAFGEGWALYAERLGLDMGLYGDPYDDFGRLLYEMWRACRLVVDTGMHAFGWTRDRAIRFMLENTALSRLNITNEVDRYIGWPGQACAYKIGELKIRELRSWAETVLGEDFDLRGFHDAVLGAGSLPLPVMETRVRRWVNRQRIVTYD